jgi:dynein heavy chain
VGKIKCATPQQSDALMLLSTMTDMYIVKSVAVDKPLFLSIINDLFPGVEFEISNDGDFETAFRKVLAEDRLQPEPALIEKILMLYDTMQTRHRNMMVGQTAFAAPAIEVHDPRN